MRAFACDYCGQWLSFENFSCLRCGAAYGYVPNECRLIRIESSDDGLWNYVGQPDSRFRRCGNADRAACNWMVRADAGFDLCSACRLNRTIPNLNVEGNQARWQRIEAAKRRMAYGLDRLGLNFEPRSADAESGLAFDFLADDTFSGDVKTGHLKGLITLNVAEADDAVRERVRNEMQEPFRTLIGHFRHEVGHYFWDRLVGGSDELNSFRQCFGDEREDYGAALERHHSEGPPGDWSQRFVSAYASSHPWEDWAESWAHYLHIVDALETAHSYGLAPQSGEPHADRAPAIAFDPYAQDLFDDMLQAMTPLAFAVNSLNRSLGQPDLYPFSLAPTVQEKLRFIHRTIRGNR